MKPLELEVTAKEARTLKSARGLGGFAEAKRIKMRAVRQARETGLPCRLVHKGEVLFTAIVDWSVDA